jgi:hypothetical protein
MKMTTKIFLPKFGNSGSIRRDYAIAVSSARNEKKYAQVTVSLSLAVMKKMRWLIGDKIAVKYDDESYFMTLFRNGVGYKLSSKMPLPDKKKRDMTGASVSSVLRFTAPGLHKVSYTALKAEDCIFGENELSFIYPEKAPSKTP